MEIYKVEEKEVGLRLDMAISSKFPQLSRSHIKGMIEGGFILLNGKVVKAGERLKLGQVLSVEQRPVQNIDASAQDVDFEIVYEDSDLLVVNKPQGLVVHPCSSTKDKTLVNGLLMKVKDLSGINGVLRPGIVHRLDKNTSGLMLVAKNDFAHTHLAEQIKNKTCHRDYTALLEGNLKDDQGRVETFIDRNKKDRKKMAVSETGKWAITDYKVLARFEKNCLVQFSLKTGRTHQIRVHALALHHPIVGDDVYGKAEKSLKGQLLCATRIEFVHPRTNKKMEFKIELPKYFKDYLKKLKEV